MKTQRFALFAVRIALCALVSAATLWPTSAGAEPTSLTIAKEYGIGYLPYMIMEHEKLVEKHTQALGLKELSITWQTFGGSGLMQGAMLAGRLDFASSGVPWFLTMWDKTKFYQENPKTYQAFTEALAEAQAFINAQPAEAARIYLAMSADKRLTQEVLVSLLANPDYKYTNVPQNIMKYAEFMFRTGAIKTKPASWKELFFPNVHGTPRS